MTTAIKKKPYGIREEDLYSIMIMYCISTSIFDLVKKKVA